MRLVLRRALAGLFVIAGVGLLAAALLHYGRGAAAQSEAREALRRQGGFATASSRPDSRGDRDDLPQGTAVPTLAGYPAGQPIARIKIASTEMDWVVFGGTDEVTLEKGPGHVPGTAMPGQSGPPQNCVITAHRDSHFHRLGWLRKGHRIELETADGTTEYRVVSREIVTPKAVRVLAPTAKPRLTLITCYPFNYIGSAPKRLIVVAEPIGKRGSAAPSVSFN